MQTILERAIARRAVPKKVERRARHDMELQWASNWLMEGSNSQAFPHSWRALVQQPGSFEGYRMLAYSLVPKRARDWAKQLVGRS
jgi:hypothetical protein